MKNIFTILTFLFLGIQITYAQDTKAAVAEMSKYAAKENALLWEISGKELTTPSYLYGTIHMINEEDFFLTQSTKKAFKECDRATFEINMDDMDNIGAQMSLMMGAFMKDGMTLKKLLSEEDYKVVDDHFSEMGLPMFLLEKIKPMFLSVFASGDMDMMGGLGGAKSDNDSTTTTVVSYEIHFMDMAKEQEKEMAGLETAEYQMSMFDSIPYKAQAEMLVESIQAEDNGEGNGEFEEMIEMYKNQDLQAMQSMLSDEGIGEYGDLLLANRNRNWIPVMEEQMADKPTFFAVGAGHLGGNVGVVALLREAGYSVKAVDPVKKKEMIKP